LRLNQLRHMKTQRGGDLVFEPSTYLRRSSHYPLR
jgi:hypothetical protein